MALKKGQGWQWENPRERETSLPAWLEKFEQKKLRACSKAAAAAAHDRAVVCSSVRESPGAGRGWECETVEVRVRVCLISIVKTKRHSCNIRSTVNVGW